MKREKFFIIGIILIVVSYILFGNKNPYWYFPATLGFWLFFDYLSHLNNKNTCLDFILNKNYKKFLILYILLSIFGAILEIFGNWLLNYWHYTYLSPFEIVVYMPIFYPFILMSLIETYRFFYSY